MSAIPSNLPPPDFDRGFESRNTAAPKGFALRAEAVFRAWLHQIQPLRALPRVQAVSRGAEKLISPGRPNMFAVFKGCLEK